MLYLTVPTIFVFLTEGTTEVIQQALELSLEMQISVALKLTFHRGKELWIYNNKKGKHWFYF